ncbi:hypothetical protein GCM10022295_19920 [Streptomyces osmaniensis]|uniref:Secreted protein n=2 Tax=Streptomyces osmaniensis TaxID=593134 RepID=A0ABP6VL44_9ACTN
MRTKQIMRSLGVAAAGAALGIGVSAGTANAASSWNLQYTQGDLVGAHAWGTVSLSGGRYHVKVNIRDTKADSHGARVYLRATYQDGWGGDRTEVLSASGSGAENSYTWNFDDTVSWFEAKECLTEQGADWTCADYSKIYGSP